MYGQRDAGIFGYPHFTGGFPGEQAEYARVPFAENNFMLVPDEISDEKAHYLSDVVPTNYRHKCT
jgi:threonine dehydrogenase-like Zn-dependent dehydrogenase